MIDTLLKFTDEPTAIADPVMQEYMDEAGEWLDDYVIAGVKVWRASEDVAGVHTFLPGWFVLVSLSTAVPALIDHPGLQIMIDREKANARGVGMIVASSIDPDILQDIRMSPVFAGADYPFGELA